MARRILVLAAAAVLTFGVSVAVAATTQVTIKLVSSGSGDTFKGKVTSSNAKCVPNRKVTVYLVEGAQPDPPNDTVIGTDKTNDQGRYAVKPEGGFASPGDFYSKVAKRRVGNVRCKKAFSEVISNV